MESKSFLNSYELVLNEIFKQYMITHDETKNLHYNEFPDSLYMKAVDVATGIYYGSLMCNYYTDGLMTYNGLQNIIGYEVYDPLEFDEEINLTTPISIYSTKIDFLDDCLSNLIELPTEKNCNWGRDGELTKKNLLKLITPIKDKGEWVLLGACVTLRGDRDYDSIGWQDSYDIWCCTSDVETIHADGDARKLTIELEQYDGLLDEYRMVTYKPWLCKKMKNIIPNSSILDNTLLVLPPADMINYFNLSFDKKEMAWVNSTSETVILCNNNKAYYYEDNVVSSIFINKKYFDKYIKDNLLKYFAFTERFVPGKGYSDETSLHFEIINGYFEKEILNSDTSYVRREKSNKCMKCKVAKEREKSLRERQNIRISWLDIIEN